MKSSVTNIWSIQNPQSSSQELPGRFSAPNLSPTNSIFHYKTFFATLTLSNPLLLSNHIHNS
jgi:hypothetical protein